MLVRAFVRFIDWLGTWLVAFGHWLCRVLLFLPGMRADQEVISPEQRDREAGRTSPPEGPDDLPARRFLRRK